MRNRNAMSRYKVDNNESQKGATCRQQIARSHPHHAVVLRAAKSQERVTWVLMARVNQLEDIELEEEFQDLDIEEASDE